MKLQWYADVITFVIQGKIRHCHNQKGQNEVLSIDVHTAQTVFELAMILGKMEVYHDQGDDENTLYMEKYFDKKCVEHDVDLDEYEEWRKFQVEHDE